MGKGGAGGWGGGGGGVGGGGVGAGGGPFDGGPVLGMWSSCVSSFFWISCEKTVKTEMMNSDMMEEVLGNPEKMEQARQAILDNPTLKQAMAQLPGFADMVST
ncbi:unnamed protein product, partial [Hapterophycus canaliculatus]